MLVACKSHVLSRQKSVLQTHTESFVKIIHYHEYTCMQMFTETNKKINAIYECFDNLVGSQSKARMTYL